MSTTYNQAAAQSVERLAALSDGIFGVAMTLLLLELHVPAKELIHNEAQLGRALAGMWPLFLVYLMSFLTLGIFWVGQQTQLNHLARSDRNVTWLHLGFLFAVTILPFSTRLLAEFISYRTALLTYWANIALLGSLLYAALGWSVRAGLVKSEITAEIRSALCRRIIIAQSLYALGAALCIFGTFWSIGAIVLVQLNFVLAPREWKRQSA